MELHYQAALDHVLNLTTIRKDGLILVHRLKGPFFLFWDFGHPEDRTFELDKGVEVGKNIAGKLIITKKGTDQGWEFRVQLYGITNRGREIRYEKGDWKTFFKGNHQSA